MNGQTICTMGLEVVVRPRRGIGYAEAQDKILGAHVQNKILDDGGRCDLSFLVCKEKSRMVGYALVPELSPPGFTLEQMAADMKNAGFDVRGFDRQRMVVFVSEVI